MMPLLMLGNGETCEVAQVKGRPEIKQHLSDIGFVPGTKVTVLQSQNGDMIVKVLETKLALTKEMASKIMVIR